MATTAHLEQIGHFVAVLELVKRALADMTPEQLRARPVAGRWSTLEVVAHLADSEQAWCHRMKRVISEDNPLLIGYDESRFTASLGYQDRDPAAELELFARMRLQMADILRGLPDSAWKRQGVHNERGLVSLEQMVQIETEHVTHHLAHLNDKRKALRLPVIA